MEFDRAEGIVNDDAFEESPQQPASVHWRHGGPDNTEVGQGALCPLDVDLLAFKCSEPPFDVSEPGFELGEFLGRRRYALPKTTRMAGSATTHSSVSLPDRVSVSLLRTPSDCFCVLRSAVRSLTSRAISPQAYSTTSRVLTISAIRPETQSSIADAATGADLQASRARLSRVAHR
jgi:hypothetical protein